MAKLTLRQDNPGGLTNTQIDGNFLNLETSIGQSVGENYYPDFDMLDDSFYTSNSGAHAFAYTNSRPLGRRYVRTQVLDDVVFTQWSLIQPSTSHVATIFAWIDNVAEASVYLEVGYIDNTGAFTRTRLLPVGVNSASYNATNSKFSLHFTTAANENRFRCALVCSSGGGGGSNWANMGGITIYKKVSNELLNDSLDLPGTPYVNASMPSENDSSGLIANTNFVQRAIDYKRPIRDVQNITNSYDVTSGTATAYLANLYPAATLTTNLSCTLAFHIANNGQACTLNIDNLGAYPLKQYAHDGTLIDPNIRAGVRANVIFNGAYYILMDSLPNQMTGFKNYLINGNFDVWQYINCGIPALYPNPQTVSGYGSDDRWVNGVQAHTRTHTYGANTSFSNPFNAAHFSRTTITATSNDPNGHVIKAQLIEDVTRLGGKTVTLSFWAKADGNKKLYFHAAQFFGSGSGDSPAINDIGSKVFDLTTTWTKFTHTFTFPSVIGKAITWYNSYSRIEFMYSYGTTLNSLYSPSITTTQQTGVFDIGQVQLEEGVTATPFEMRPLELEVALCQRYFEYGAFMPSGVTYLPNGDTRAPWQPFKVPKRTQPTVTINGFAVVLIGMTRDTDGVNWSSGITLFVTDGGLRVSNLTNYAAITGLVGAGNQIFVWAAGDKQYIANAEI